LSLTLSGAGSNSSTLPYAINITPTITNVAGNTYTGTIVTSGSAFAPDNKTTAVTMNVTTLPIVEALARSMCKWSKAGHLLYLLRAAGQSGKEHSRFPV